MSQPIGFGLNGKSIYKNICKPMDVTVSFTVDSLNVNQLGITSLKSNGYVQSVFMGTQAGAPAGTPAYGTARSYGILAASAITNTGSSVITGNIGEYPGTAVTGIPPGTVSGASNINNVAAQQAKASAQASYTALQALTPTTIATELGTQTLVPGTYKAASGTFTLNGTVTLNGLGVYVFQTTTTLVTGASSAPIITLTGGARAQDIYWVVGSSATLSSGTAGIFKGNLIAAASVTSTITGASVLGSLVALTGAVTLSAATAITTVALSPTLTSGNPNPGIGYGMIQFKNNFNVYLGGYMQCLSPLSGTNVAVTSGGALLVVGQPYVISVVGTTTAAQWLTLGLKPGLTPAVGQSFIALVTGAGAGSGQVQVPSVSGVSTVEVIGNPNTMISNSNIATNGGAIVLFQFLLSGIPTAPVDGTIVDMQFCFDGSTVSIPDSPGVAGL